MPLLSLSEETQNNSCNSYYCPSKHLACRRVFFSFSIPIKVCCFNHSITQLLLVIFCYTVEKEVHMKYLIPIVIIVIILGVAGYLFSSKNKTNKDATASPNTVAISNFAFSPAELTVSPGTEVTFVNNDSVDHTVTSDSGSFDSGTLKSGASFKQVFSTAGTFGYRCNIHLNMKGTIIVK